MVTMVDSTKSRMDAMKNFPGGARELNCFNHSLPEQKQTYIDANVYTGVQNIVLGYYTIECICNKDVGMRAGMRFPCTDCCSSNRDYSISVFENRFSNEHLVLNERRAKSYKSQKFPKSALEK